jgi:hypothetical protein
VRSRFRSRKKFLMGETPVQRKRPRQGGAGAARWIVIVLTGSG